MSKYLNSILWLTRSNPRYFKIESFHFADFVPKMIAYFRFWNKIPDRNKTFPISTQKFGPKAFVLFRFQIFVETTKSFGLSFKNPVAIWNFRLRFDIIKKSSVLIHKKLGANKNVRTGQKIGTLKPRCMETFRCDNKLTQFCSGFV